MPRDRLRRDTWLAAGAGEPRPDDVEQVDWPGEFIGLAVVTEAWLRNSDTATSAKVDPGVRVDEVRVVFAVDVDGRHYQVTRRRGTGEREISMLTPAEYQRTITARRVQPRIPDAVRGIVETLHHSRR